MSPILYTEFEIQRIDRGHKLPSPIEFEELGPILPWLPVGYTSGREAHHAELLDFLQHDTFDKQEVQMRRYPESDVELVLPASSSI